MTTRHSTRQTLQPPPRSELGTDFGLACDPALQIPSSDRHDRCNGWWPRFAGDPTGDGWRCACSCHEDGRGWPGFDQYLAFRTRHY